MKINNNLIERKAEELYDMQGSKVLNRIISNNERINIESLNKGLYFYKLKADGKIQSGKVIVSD